MSDNRNNNTMNTIQMYDAQADNINVDDIATNDNNRIVLRRMKRNKETDIGKLYIQNEHDEDGEDCEDYVPEGAYDMGWLGYFIGRNENLKSLFFSTFTPTSGASVAEVLNPFFKGLSGNKSITALDFGGTDLLDGKVFTMLGPFFENCPTLANLTIQDCHLGDDGWRLLALALGSSKHKSLQKVYLTGNNISDEGSVDIFTSLSLHPNLETLWLKGNQLATNGCITLSTLLRCSATELKYLYLDNNDINDEGIEALVPALKKCHQLHTLYMNENTSITSKGWQKLASMLEAPNSSQMTTLAIQRNNIDDQAATAFSSTLANNSTLKNLYLHDNEPITDKGWKAFSKLLCDASSINSTYLSNHTLQYVANTFAGTRASSLKPLLDLNKKEHKKEVAIIKILQHHNDFDMTPFFEWEFKVLPLMINWFQIASSNTMPDDFETNIGPRTLSSIYQFVRGMPLLYVETRIRKELEDIKASESQMEEEQFLLRQEQLMLDLKLQRLRQRKQSVKDQKESLLEKLAR